MFSVPLLNSVNISAFGGTFCCLGVAICACLLAPPLWAQVSADTLTIVEDQNTTWSLQVEGRNEAWPLQQGFPPDSIYVVAHEIVAHYQRDGYYFVRIDSTHIDSTQTPISIRLFVDRGIQVDIGRVSLQGVVSLDSLALLRSMDTRPGQTLDLQRMEADLDAILLRYEEVGFPLTQVEIHDISVEGKEKPRLYITINVAEGPALTLQRVEVQGAERTKSRFVERIAELRPGQPLLNYDPEGIQQRLAATEFFKTVGIPELLVEGDSSAVLRIPLEEEAPGAFDLVLGYQPSPGGQGGGNLVGNGHLVLRNLFGGGRLLALKLNRLPGQISSVDVRLADPFILGLPFSVEGRFAGLQQDSTYGKQDYILELGYRFTGGLQAYGTFSREVTNPGQAGLRLVGNRQRIPQASTVFGGIGFRFQRVDQPVNPRRGFWVESSFEEGQKERRERRVTAEQDTTDERTRLRQERFLFAGRVFLPTFTRQVLVLGGDAYALLSNEYDQSDLFRIGGASTLRGYDEERFLVPFAARGLVEYRYQLSRVSYGFAFLDLGYVQRSAVTGLDPIEGFYPGYGVGFQVGTDIGLILFSLASNPEDATGVRAHVGLSIGL